MSISSLFRVNLPYLIMATSIVYLGIVALLRLVPKRETGSMAPQDMIAAVLIGNLAIETMLPEEASPLDRLLLIAVVLLWGYVLDWMADRIPVMRRVLREPPTLLVRDGLPLRRSLRREMLSEDELLAQLRKQGVAELGEVRLAYMEADGTVSVIKR